MKIAKYIVFIFIIQSVCLFSQGRVIDSLKLKLKTAKEDTSKVNTLNELAKKFAKIHNFDTALYFSNNAKLLAGSIKFEKGEAKSLMLIGYIYNNTGNYNEAFKNYLRAFEISMEIRDKNGAASACINIANSFVGRANYTQAMNYYLQALQIRQEMGDKNGIASAYIGIGVVYNHLGNYPEALKNQLAALQIKEQQKNTSNEVDVKGIALSYMNIGNIYAKQKNYNDALKNFSYGMKFFIECNDELGIADSYESIGSIFALQKKYKEAVENFNKALEIQNRIEDLEGIANTYINLGNLFDEQGNYLKASKNHAAALKISEEIEDKYGMADAYNNIGVTEFKLKKFKSAKSWQEKALNLSMELGEIEIIKDSYYSLSEIETALGNYKSAIDNYKMYIVYRDSLLNEENTKKIVQTQMQYEFDKKESLAKLEQDKKDSIAAEEKQKQTIITSSIALGLIIVTVFAFFVFRSLRTTRKQKDIIELQKHEVEKQKTLVEIQKHEIEEKHKEITDSINYAERIQRSFLASDELLNTHLQDYFVLFKPKDVVSGDFYWAEKFVSLSGSDNFIMVTADSTGHGVPGAIMSLLNITSLELAIKDGFTEPSDILNATRKTIIERLKKDGSAEGGKDGMDCSLLMFDFKHLVLKIAAANNPVWIVRNSGTEAIEVLEIKPDKMPVGKHDRQGTSFTQQEVQLQSGDVVYTLTDGFPDQFGGEKGKKFMSKNLRELLASHSHFPMSQQKELLEKTFSNWVGNLEQIDDVTIIGVRI